MNDAQPAAVVPLRTKAAREVRSVPQDHPHAAGGQQQRQPYGQGSADDPGQSEERVDTEIDPRDAKLPPFRADLLEMASSAAESSAWRVSSSAPISINSWSLRSRSGVALESPPVIARPDSVSGSCRLGRAESSHDP